MRSSGSKYIFRSLRAGEDFVSKLRSEIAHIAKSINSVDFTDEEYNVDSNGVIDKSQGWTRHEVTANFEGMRKHKMYSVWNDRTAVTGEFWENGEYHYGINRVKSDLGVIDNVIVSKQANSPSDYRGIMCVPLWLISPAGRALGDVLEKQHEYKFSYVASTKSALLTFTHHQMHIKCSLDQSHEWLPSEVIAENVLRIEVDGFTRADGRWFPASGTYERLTDHYKQRFVVTNVSINRVGMRKRDFDLIPTLGPGVLVLDRATREGEFVGGQQARDEHVKRTRSPGVELVSSTDDHPNATRHSHSGLVGWPTYFAGITAIVLFVLSAILIRSSRK